jgi:hypothetical protein
MKRPLIALPVIRLSDTREDRAFRPPAASVLLGAGAMMPIFAGALAVLCNASWTPWLIHAVTVWASGVLCFLGGVRRGLSFRRSGGPTVGEVLASLWLFTCGLAAFAATRPAESLMGLIVGYGSLAILDSAAARRAVVPRYFKYFRPLQVILPILSFLFFMTRLT